MYSGLEQELFNRYDRHTIEKQLASELKYIEINFPESRKAYFLCCISAQLYLATAGSLFQPRNEAVFRQMRILGSEADLVSSNEVKGISVKHISPPSLDCFVVPPRSDGQIENSFDGIKQITNTFS